MRLLVENRGFPFELWVHFVKLFTIFNNWKQISAYVVTLDFPRMFITY